MNLSLSLEQLASDARALQISTGIRCTAANFRWERAVLDARSTEYNAYVGEVVAHDDWQAEHKGYLSSFVHVPKDLPRSSECFMSINGQAHLSDHFDNAFLLRLESIGPLFQHPLLSELAGNFWQRFFNSQKDLRKDRLSDGDEQLRNEFVAQWNEQRTQARPLFATFLNDFGGDLAALLKSDWPHILRDRLGLTHWPSTVGKALPVALMCYTVEDVREAAAMTTKKGTVASFTRPTVLDAEMSAAFIPAPLFPEGQSYGYTLDLANMEIPDVFTPELLNFPIEYHAKHIKGLGYISRGHALEEDEAMLAARNRHVQGLQRLPGCNGFGEVIA